MQKVQECLGNRLLVTISTVMGYGVMIAGQDNERKIGVVPQISPVSNRTLCIFVK
ncbi:hypothetical protein KIN20_035368 [Parelaphostrongylus tenuis]|uniref:Uncharacterized protein n=1 Tax=Parelaphostrongylus tenuis TaxID=148309 RepID=A0AAD5WKG2_PARTN|nr:hypothetical protein KIN20_035368 [Parelaphostrongylus tenuis]